jgi:hypothetical protein
MARDELAYYFGEALISELDVLRQSRTSSL